MVTKDQLDLAKKLAYYESEVEKVKKEMNANPVSCLPVNLNYFLIDIESDGGKLLVMQFTFKHKTCHFQTLLIIH